MSGTDQTPRGLYQLPRHGFSPVLSRIAAGGRASFSSGLDPASTSSAQEADSHRLGAAGRTQDQAC